MRVCRDSEPLNILTVGQSSRDRAALADSLRGTRWHVRHLPGVRATLDQISRERIHAVVSNLRLPDGCWYELCDAQVPVIVTTETLAVPFWAEALSRGAYDVLVKPFEVEEVMYVVRNACLFHLRNYSYRGGNSVGS
jgi:DNA-binding NtrC family response regulator